MLKIKKEENEILAVGQKNFISRDQIGFTAPTELNERERNKLTSTMNGILLLNHKSWTATEYLQAHNFIWKAFQIT